MDVCIPPGAVKVTPGLVVLVEVLVNNADDANHTGYACKDEHDAAHDLVVVGMNVPGKVGYNL